MKNYTIQIVTNDTSENVPPFSVFCKELNIGTDDFTVEDALIGLLSGIKIIEEDIAKEHSKKHTWKPGQTFEFSLPIAA